MRRAVRWAVAVLGVQATLVGLYWLVEGQPGSQPGSGAAGALGTQPPQRVDMSMPPLTVRRRDGSTLELPQPTRPTLVHIWATWCPPCRAELPSLLELPGKHAVEVVAIALDEDWGPVQRLLGGSGAPNVFLAHSEDVHRALGVRSLPVTFLLNDQGRIALRFDGARDWADESFVHRYLEQLAGAR